MTILAAANDAWQECLELGEVNGYRNAQASLLAPTGCLTADSLLLPTVAWPALVNSAMHTATGGRISISPFPLTKGHAGPPDSS